MKSSTRKFIKKFCLGIIGFLLVFSIISIIVVKVVYDGQFVKYNRPDETVTATLRYEDIAMDYPRELVSFKSGENLLQGYVYGMNANQGLVVIAHGLGGGADSYLPQIAYFLENGWSVFAYDATGCYDSEGKTTKGFPQALLDLDAALTYINARSEFVGIPIMLFGHSWGGYAVANALHFQHEIAGVVSVAGPSSPMEIVLEQGRRMMGIFINTQQPYLWLYQRLLFGEVASLNAVDAINNSSVPILIVHGIEDDSVAYGGSGIIAKRSTLTNPNLQVLALDEPGHSGHNNIFRSKDAIAYIGPLNEEYRVLYAQYDGEIPYEVNQAFYAKVDRTLAQELNLELMDKINTFFLQCLGDVEE